MSDIKSEEIKFVTDVGGTEEKVTKQEGLMVDWAENFGKSMEEQSECSAGISKNNDSKGSTDDNKIDRFFLIRFLLAN